MPAGRFPYWFVALGLKVLVRCFVRLRPSGFENLPDGPAILCFNHQSWLDPFFLVAALPSRPDLILFGPREADMTVGARNRVIAWSGRGIPFHPDHGNLLEATRAVEAALAGGVRLAIAPEGRIHAGEQTLLPLNEGVAFFALRAGVPVVPVAISGAGWIRFGKTIRVRAGPPIPVAGRPTRAAVAALTAATRDGLLSLTAGEVDEAPPGGFWCRVTELFNDWPEGGRPAPVDGAGQPVLRLRRRAGSKAGSLPVSGAGVSLCKDSPPGERPASGRPAGERPAGERPAGEGCPGGEG